MATGIFALAARLLGISPDIAKLIAILIAIAVALGSAWGGYAYIKHLGQQEARDQIQKENTDAIKRGFDARLSFDDCLAAGGVYDFRRQRCTSHENGAR